MALVNRGPWWPYAVFSLLVAVLVYFSYIGGALLAIDRVMGSVEQDNVRAIDAAQLPHRLARGRQDRRSRFERGDGCLEWRLLVDFDIIEVRGEGLTRVVRILTDGEGRAKGVEYVDAAGDVHVQEARTVILCGYTFENVRLLLLSGVGVVAAMAVAACATEAQEPGVTGTGPTKIT